MIGGKLFVMGLAIWVSAAPALAAEAARKYPNRPIRMMMPNAPGSSTDTLGRVVANKLGDVLGQQVVVDNRAGASGNIGVETAVRASADGYTFLLGNVGTMAINPVYYVKFQYKPLKDLIPITQVVDVPGSLVVNPTLTARSAKELVAHLKANPGKLNYGSAAPSSANNLEMIMFLNMSGTSAVGVPYKGGAGPANVGLIANEVQMAFITFSSALPHVKSNRMRMIGVVSPERNPALPEVLTMREQGFDMTVGSWQGLFVPAGTPRAVVNKLHQVAHETMKNPLVQKRLVEGGVSIVTTKSPEEFRNFVQAETDRFGKVIRDSKIQTE